MTAVSSKEEVVGSKHEISRYVTVMMANSVQCVEVACGCSLLEPGRRLGWWEVAKRWQCTKCLRELVPVQGTIDIRRTAFPFHQNVPKCDLL